VVAAKRGAVVCTHICSIGIASILFIIPTGSRESCFSVNAAAIDPLMLLSASGMAPVS